MNFFTALHSRGKLGISHTRVLAEGIEHFLSEEKIMKGEQFHPADYVLGSPNLSYLGSVASRAHRHWPSMETYRTIRKYVTEKPSLSRETNIELREKKTFSDAIRRALHIGALPEGGSEVDIALQTLEESVKNDNKRRLSALHELRETGAFEPRRKFNLIKEDLIWKIRRDLIPDAMDFLLSHRTIYVGNDGSQESFDELAKAIVEYRKKTIKSESRQ